MNRVIFYAVFMPLATIGALSLVVWATKLPDYTGQIERKQAESRAKQSAADEIEWAKSVLAKLKIQEQELADEERRLNALAASTSCPLHIRLALGELPFSYKMLAINRIGPRLVAERMVEGRGDKDDGAKLQAEIEAYADTYARHVVKVRALTAHLTKRDYGVTMDAYNAIKPGMSLIEVEEVIGLSCERKEISRAGSFVTYVWGDKSGVVVAAFDGDRLVSKSQLGL